MFPRRYFPARFFAPRYFPAYPAAVTSGYGPDVELTLTINRTASIGGTMDRTASLTASINRTVSKDSEFT